MSSRNRLLMPEARLVAPRIYQALLASSMEAEGGQRSVPRLLRGLITDISAIPGAVLDYAEIRDEETLLPLTGLKPESKARIFVAVRFGSVRLIDNLPIRLPRSSR